MSKIKPVVVFNSDKDLVDTIKDFKGYSMASIDMTTVPKCTVKSRLNKDVKYGDVFEGTLMCTSHRYIGIGFDYNTSLNNQVEKAIELKLEKTIDSALVEEKRETGNIETGELPWGQWFEGSKIIIEHKGNFYLRLTYLNANGKYSDKIYHYENGDEISEETALRLDEFLPISKSDSPLIVNSVKIAGIVRVDFGGKTYVRKGYLTVEDKTRLNTWLQAVSENDDIAIASEVA